MTTPTPFGDTTILSLNVTTKEDDSLYKSSGAIIAAVVVVIIIILTVVLLLLKKYNSSRRDARNLSSSPYATGAHQAATPVLELKEIAPEKMRARRELEPKSPKSASPSARGPKSSRGKHHATVTFRSDDVQMETR